MNCHYVLPSLETGGPLERRRAARHLRDCPKCQAAERALAALKSELAAAPPLSAEMRQRWLEVADTPVEIARSESVKNRRLMWTSVAVAACLLIAVGIAVQIFHSVGRREEIAQSERHVGAITIVEVDPATEFARIDERLGDLQADVAGMAGDAQRLLAEQQIERLLADHRNWLAVTQRQPLISP
jgi:hypothetical protein